MFRLGLATSTRADYVCSRQHSRIAPAPLCKCKITILADSCGKWHVTATEGSWAHNQPIENESQGQAGCQRNDSSHPSRNESSHSSLSHREKIPTRLRPPASGQQLGKKSFADRLPVILRSLNPRLESFAPLLLKHGVATKAAFAHLLYMGPNVSKMFLESAIEVEYAKQTPPFTTVDRMLFLSILKKLGKQAGVQFLEFEISHGRLRYANNSNYRNDSLIRKETHLSPLTVSEIKRIVHESEIVKEDDKQWPERNIVGRQEMEVRLGDYHVSFETAKIGSLVDVQQSDDPDGLRVFYYLVQDLKIFIFSLISLHFKIKPPPDQVAA
ncbi:hypothetical protein OIV83_001939 [Microbotryomycetes sp. JL201]|nr:hypothetical protein OIV83_001939 [Microbotryomycetes sp. JL201]